MAATIHTVTGEALQVLILLEIFFHAEAGDDDYSTLARPLLNVLNHIARTQPEPRKI